jgi:hypothetical protein
MFSLLRVFGFPWRFLQVGKIIDALCIDRLASNELFPPEKCDVLPPYFYQYCDVSTTLTKRATMEHLDIDDEALGHRSIIDAVFNLADTHEESMTMDRKWKWRRSKMLTRTKRKADSLNWHGESRHTLPPHNWVVCLICCALWHPL